MIRYLAAALAALVLAAACDSRTPTAPSANPLPSAVPAAPPTGFGPAPIASTPIVAGSLIQGTVEPGDPVCFPNWDSSGHCRQFDLTASTDGILLATLKWERPSLGLYRPRIVPDVAGRSLGLLRGSLARKAPQFSRQRRTDLSHRGDSLSTPAAVRGAGRGAVMKSAASALVTLLVESAFGRRSTRNPPSAIPTTASRRINSGPALANQFTTARARATPNHGVDSPAMITMRPSTRSVRGARDAGAAKTKTSPIAILRAAMA